MSSTLRFVLSFIGSIVVPSATTVNNNDKIVSAVITISVKIR